MPFDFDEAQHRYAADEVVRQARNVYEHFFQDKPRSDNLEDEAVIGKLAWALHLYNTSLPPLSAYRGILQSDEDAVAAIRRIRDAWDDTPPVDTGEEESSVQPATMQNTPDGGR